MRVSYRSERVGSLRLLEEMPFSWIWKLLGPRFLRAWRDVWASLRG